MPLTRLLLCFALLFGSARPLASQSVAATLQRDPQAEALVRQAIAALGGELAWSQVTDAVTVGNIRAGGPEAGR